jgi:hypothetical protein
VTRRFLREVVRDFRAIFLRVEQSRKAECRGFYNQKRNKKKLKKGTCCHWIPDYGPFDRHHVDGHYWMELGSRCKTCLTGSIRVTGQAVTRTRKPTKRVGGVIAMEGLMKCIVHRTINGRHVDKN